MECEGEMFFDTFSTREAEYSAEVVGRLAAAPWAAPLLGRIAEAGGINRDARGFLFEARFADALHQAGMQAQYEIAGENGSTIDFGLDSQGQAWAVEMMRLEETAAAVQATHARTDEDGVEWFSRNLSSNAKNPTQSEEGETLKAIERICQKCERDGQPHKFPQPGNRMQVILVDFRTFLHGGDNADRIHVALGGEYLRNGFFRRFWKKRLISGVFSDRTNLRGACEARERVHFIGFVNEKDFDVGTFSAQTAFVANPRLFGNADEVRQAISSWPLQPARVLNL